MALHMLNIHDALQQKKTTLKKVEHTVVTRRDGSRYRLSNVNGSTSELPKLKTEGCKDAYTADLLMNQGTSAEDQG